MKKKTTRPQTTGPLSDPAAAPPVAQASSAASSPGVPPGVPADALKPVLIVLGGHQYGGTLLESGGLIVPAIAFTQPLPQAGDLCQITTATGEIRRISAVETSTDGAWVQLSFD